MADITVTAAQVGSVYPDGENGTEIMPVVLAAAATAGQALYINSNGKADLADANGSGTLQFRGIALTGGAAGEVVQMLKRGFAYGYTLSGMSYDAAAYVSNTAGSLADAAGATTINAGRVAPISTVNGVSKVLYIEADWLRAWS